MISSAIENNITSIAGNVFSELEFSHEIYGEKFYTVYIRVQRLSDIYDNIPVIFSERLVDVSLLKKDVFCEVEGQFRSYNNFQQEGKKLILNVFARDIRIREDYKKHVNRVFLNGFVCKDPVYRVTPLGREIADVLVAVNRPYNKSDYIPCIAWGRNARFIEKFKIGENLKVWGRIQSRKYQKKLRDGKLLERIAYEMSIAKVEKDEGGSMNDSKEEQSNKNGDVKE
jgi:single-stranded DNA-binding protein